MLSERKIRFPSLRRGDDFLHPLAGFSTADHLAKNPDVVPVGMVPLDPHLRYGLAEHPGGVTLSRSGSACGPPMMVIPDSPPTHRVTRHYLEAGPVPR
jgi:hypothetical protein